MIATPPSQVNEHPRDPGATHRYNRLAMPANIRPIEEHERDRLHFLQAYSFAGDRSPEGRAGFLHVEEMGQPIYGLWEDGALVASLRVYPMRMFLHGVSIPTGGVSSVACLPEHRRKGYVGQLLRHALVLMREKGQPLSTLFTPHPALYRRFGWMYASRAVRYSFNPKDIALTDSARPKGHAHRISEEQWPAVAEVYRQYAASRNGYLDRDERWWKEALFRRIYDPKRHHRDVALWGDGHGNATGYIVYEVETTGPQAGHGKLEADELIALDGDAYLGLLRYLMSHDLAGEIFLWGPVDAPLTLCVEEPWRIKQEVYHGFMLRLVDLPAAFAARPLAAGAPEGAFTVAIADAAAPWNQGAWRIESSGGRLTATKAKGAAEISTGAAALAAMYNGFLRPSDAVASGLAEASDAAAVALADRILSVDYPPYPSDSF